MEPSTPVRSCMDQLYAVARGNIELSKENAAYETVVASVTEIGEAIQRQAFPDSRVALYEGEVSVYCIIRILYIVYCIFLYIIYEMTVTSHKETDGH